MCSFHLGGVFFTTEAPVICGLYALRFLCSAVPSRKVCRLNLDITPHQKSWKTSLLEYLVNREFNSQEAQLFPLSSFFFFFAFLPVEPCRVSGSPIRGCGTDFATGTADGMKNSLSNYWALSRFDLGLLLKHEESYLCHSIGPIEVGSCG